MAAESFLCLFTPLWHAAAEDQSDARPESKQRMRVSHIIREEKLG